MSKEVSLSVRVEDARIKAAQKWNTRAENG